jgi:hypothetical protein
VAHATDSSLPSSNLQYESRGSLSCLFPMGMVMPGKPVKGAIFVKVSPSRQSGFLFAKRVCSVVIKKATEVALYSPSEARGL